MELPKGERPIEKGRSRTIEFDARNPTALIILNKQHSLAHKPFCHLNKYCTRSFVYAKTGCVIRRQMFFVCIYIYCSNMLQKEGLFI